jgi:hypothetical protein
MRAISRHSLQPALSTPGLFGRVGSDQCRSLHLQYHETVANIRYRLHSDARERAAFRVPSEGRGSGQGQSAGPLPVEFDHFVRGLLAPAGFGKVVDAATEKRTGGGIECDRDVLAGLIARRPDRFDDELASLAHGHELRVRVEGQLVFNSITPILEKGRKPACARDAV